MPTPSIDRERLCRDILSDGTADYTGLYEIIWALNHQYPEVSREQKIAAAQSIIGELLNERRVTLYSTLWASNHYEQVPPEEALAAIESRGVWDDPSIGSYLCFAAA